MSNFRLRTDSSFFVNAERVTTPLGLVYVRKTAHREDGIAIITPKKHFPRAVDRHRVKRRLRAILTTLALSGQIVIVAHRVAQNMEFDELKAQLSRALGK